MPATIPFRKVKLVAELRTMEVFGTLSAADNDRIRPEYALIGNPGGGSH